MISEEKKKKLRKILEKISTPDEMKAFDVEILSKKEDESTKLIIDKIEESKSILKWDFVQSLIEKAEKAISEKIDEFKKEFEAKKYPTFDDSEIRKKLSFIEGDLKEHSLIKEATNKNQSMMMNELINIGDILLTIQGIIESTGKASSDKKLDTINQSLEGVGSLLLRILGKTGSTNSTITGNLAVKMTVSGTTTYVAKAAIGSAQASAVWQVEKIDESLGTVITWADGNDYFDNVATDLSSLSYS